MFLPINLSAVPKMRNFRIISLFANINIYHLTNTLIQRYCYQKNTVAPDFTTTTPIQEYLQYSNLLGNEMFLGSATIFDKVYFENSSFWCSFYLIKTFKSVDKSYNLEMLSWSRNFPFCGRSWLVHKKYTRLATSRWQNLVYLVW